MTTPKRSVWAGTRTRLVVAGALLLLVAGCSATEVPRSQERSTSVAPPSAEGVIKPAADDPTSGYCALLLFDGRTYEVAHGQQGSTGVARPLGEAQGRHCGADGDRLVAVHSANEQGPEPALTASYGNRVIVYWSEHSAELVPVPYAASIRQTGGVAEEHLALVRAFAQFAVMPTRSYRDAVGFAQQGLQIGLGPRLRHTSIDDAGVESAWSIPAEGFAGRDGRINVLDMLREHLMDVLVMRLTRPDESLTDLHVSYGTDARCVDPPTDVPATPAHMRGLSIQPEPDTIESCLEWFAINLHLNESGSVEVVSLDLWEP